MTTVDFFVTLTANDPALLARVTRSSKLLERFADPAPPRPWRVRANAPFLMKLGEDLFQLAFPDHREFVDQFSEAVTAGATFRVWLHAPDARLAGLPWEYLCLTQEAVDACRARGVDIPMFETRSRTPAPQSFLTLQPQVSLVRQANPHPPDARLERIGALRIIIVSANPATEPWGSINGLETEIGWILNGLRGLPAGHVRIERLDRATRDGLAQKLKSVRPHVLHYVGHGAFPGAPDDPADGRLVAPSLVLEGKPGYEYLTAVELRALCSDCGAQVVVLNCCWGGRTSVAARGIAHELTGAGPAPLPVAVAMQLAMPETAAVGFASSFYSSVGVATSIEEAIRTFRIDSVNAHPHGCGLPDWGIPVVVMGTRDSTLFRVERIDPYPISFGPLIERHIPIVGRKFLNEKLDVFLQQDRLPRSTGGGGPKRVFLLTAVPGVGKTAFLAQWASDHRALHFFFRATEGETNPDDCIGSLYEGLLGGYGILDAQPTRDPLEVRRRFVKLLQRVSAECERQRRNEVLVVDALDEAGPSPVDYRFARDVLPLDLPPHVYLILSSRPSPEAEDLSRERFVEHFQLEATSNDNLADAVDYCVCELQGRVVKGGNPVPAKTLDALCIELAERAEGNFLVLKLFLGWESLGDRLTVAALRKAARDLTGAVANEYEKFFSRLTRRVTQHGTMSAPGALRLREETLKLVYAVLAAFTAARAPVTREQVCRAFDLKTWAWDEAFGYIQQFLERSGVRQEEQGVLTHRIYHKTFQEFLTQRLAPDLPEAERRWADYCTPWRDLTGYPRLYALRHLPSHLIAAAKGS